MLFFSPGEDGIVDFYHYLEEQPSGRLGQMLSTEHMLYTWEAAESLEVDEDQLKAMLSIVCSGEPKYYFITRKGDHLRCYRLKDIVDAVMKIRQNSIIKDIPAN